MTTTVEAAEAAAAAVPAAQQPTLTYTLLWDYNPDRGKGADVEPTEDARMLQIIRINSSNGRVSLAFVLDVKDRVRTIRPIIIDEGGVLTIAPGAEAIFSRKRAKKLARELPAMGRVHYEKHRTRLACPMHIDAIQLGDAEQKISVAYRLKDGTDYFDAGGSELNL